MILSPPSRRAALVPALFTATIFLSASLLFFVQPLFAKIVLPRIGGAAAVAGWNSAQCGTCWQLTYNGKSINVLAVDHTDAGFNIAKAAMNTLTGGHAEEFGRVDATATQVSASACGL